MKRFALLLIFVLTFGGCNLITPQTVAIHAGKVVAKEVIKHIDKSSSEDDESKD